MENDKYIRCYLREPVRRASSCVFQTGGKKGGGKKNTRPPDPYNVRRIWQRVHASAERGPPSFAGITRDKKFRVATLNAESHGQFTDARKQ